MSLAKLVRHAAASVIGFACAGAALAQQPFIYPTQGQTPQQLEFDKGQCYTWAVQQSGYDPANPPPPGAPPPQSQQQSDQVAKGIFGGALLGAGIGSATGGSAGEGALIGAIFGGIRRASQAQAQQQQQQQQQQQAGQAQGLGNYQRAFGACMNGRGYNVN